MLLINNKKYRKILLHFVKMVSSFMVTGESDALQQLVFDAYITSSLEEFWISREPIIKQDLQSDDTDDKSSKQNNTDDIRSERFLRITLMKH